MGWGSGVSTLAPGSREQVAAAGHFVTLQDSNGAVMGLRYGIASNAITTTTGTAITHTEAGLGTTAITVTDITRFPTPGSGGAPGTCYAAIEASSNATWFPVLVSYTGISGSDLTGVALLPEIGTAITTFFPTFTKTISSGSTIRVCPPPQGASSFIRMATTAGVDDVQNGRINDVVANFEAIFRYDVSASKTKMAQITASDFAYAGWYRPDNGPHPDLGQEQATLCSWSSGAGVYGIYHGTSGGMLITASKVNTCLVAYRCNTNGSAATTNDFLNLDAESFGLVGYWAGGGASKFRNSTWNGGKLLCQKTAKCAAYLDVNYEDVTLVGMRIRGDSAATSQHGIWNHAAEGLHISGSNIVRNFPSGYGYLQGTAATRTDIDRGFFRGMFDTPTILGYEGTPVVTQRVGHIMDAAPQLKMQTIGTAGGTAYTVSVAAGTLVRCRFRCSAQNQGKDVSLEGVISNSAGTHAWTQVAIDSQGTTPPVFSFDTATSGQIGVKIASGNGTISGLVDFEVLSGYPLSVTVATGTGGNSVSV